MFDSKDKKKLPPVERDAKMSVLGDLKKMAEEAMGSKVSGLKKVTIAAPDKQGLEQGLDKAKMMLDKHLGGEAPSEEADEESQEDPAEEASESPAMEASEEASEDLSPEEIDEQIAQLEAMKARKHMKRM